MGAMQSVRASSRPSRRRRLAPAAGRGARASLGVAGALRRLLAATLLAAALLAPLRAGAAPQIRLVSYDLDTKRALIALATELDLSQSLRDAVEGGTELGFNLELKVMRERWYGNELLAHYRWPGRLRRVQYGQGYEYQEFGEDQWADAASIDAALAALDELSFEVTESALINQMRSFDAFLSYRLEVDLDMLPNPLKVDLLTSAEWKFSSGWLETHR